ncbi:MAG TPA: ATP-binding protein [Solirubrobacteraceae bacterium]|nr:ATP-binding protein [Solirubrobacteraceae bacterium]
MAPVQADLDITVAAAPTAAGEARRALAARRLVASEREPELLLLVSELVTNSVRHAGLTDEERIRLRARCVDDSAYVEVCDAGHSGHLPGKREPSLDALEPGGLGLVLVDEMADRWGVEQGDGETCVWFELARA